MNLFYLAFLIITIFSIKRQEFEQRNINDENFYHIVAFNQKNQEGYPPMVRYSYSLNSINDAKPFFETQSFHFPEKKEFPSDFFYFNNSIMMNIGDEMRSSGYMERDVKNLTFVKFYKNAFPLNPSYTMFLDANGNIIVGDFQYVGEEFINDIYSGYFDGYNDVIDLVLKMKSVGGDCFVDGDFAIDQKTNIAYFKCDDHSFENYFFIVDLNIMEEIGKFPYPKPKYPGLGGFDYYDNKLYGFLYDDSANYHSFGYLDLKTQKIVKLDYFIPPEHSVFFDVNDAQIIQEDGLLYVSLQVWYDVSNEKRESYNYWLTIDLVEEKVLYFEKSGRDPIYIDLFGIIPGKPPK